jgi:tetratricopeptide (TPR) repeat protein
VVRRAAARAAAAPLEAEYARAAARPPADAAGSGGVASSIHAPASPSAATAPGATPPAADASASAARAGSGRSSRFVVALVVGCLVVAGVAALLLSGVGRGDAMSEGIAAYEAGQRMVARLAFERAAGDEPSDARPFVYLGRLAREDGDLPQARRLLEQAVQRDPGNPLAHRELASALLADGQPELARRFYVRSLAIDPTDRLAQGFLGCALARLGRADEARRWLDRAGPGDWSACAGVLPPPTGRP